jgi:hypothetical protein
MSRKREKQKGILQKTAERIILEVENENYSSDPNAFILDDDESATIQRIHLQTLGWSALLGALGVIILFCTKYAFPTWFPRTLITIPIVDYSFRYNIIFTLYGFVLAYIELYILYYVNLKAIKRLVVVCNYPHPSNPDFRDEVQRLAAVGLEKASKHGKEIGMNPYQGVPKVALTVYLLVNFYKAALSNILIRVVVSRMGGRTLGRVFMDMLGVPVFAFWNVLASRKILREAQIRIFSKPLTEKFVKEIYLDFKDSSEFKEFVYDTLQYISIIKRSYNYSHYMFGNLLLGTFNIPVVKKHELPENYFERLEKSAEKTQRGIEKIIIFGMVIDGKISASEMVMIKKAIDHRIITRTVEDIQELCKNYYRGKGLPGLVSII